jgi:chromosome segregation ATPase
MAAAEARIAELQQMLEQREVDNRGRGAHEKDLEVKLALREKALSLMQRDLTTAQGIAAAYLESLRSLEGRRGLFQELSTSLYWEVDARDTRLARLEEQLSAATARARDLESALSERTERIATLEKEAGKLSAAAAQREEMLRQAALTGDDLKRDVGTLTEGLAMRDERIRTLEVTTIQQSGLLAERQAETDRANAERVTLNASVDSLESRLTAETARAAELEMASRTAQSRCEELDAANSVQRRRVEQLDIELATVRAELQQRAVALQEASLERNVHMGRIAAAEAQAEELEQRILEQQEFVRVLQAECNAGVARGKEQEGDLRAAEDMINRLETELRGRNSRLDELEKTNQKWRVTVEEARTALIDRDSLIRRLEEETANSAVLLGAIQQRLDATGTHEIAPDGDKRLLIRSEGGSDVVHVLSRKTTVGRTPDNDLQIDTRYISRHHAVILAGPIHTIIEDLNSTNGVSVNGRRISRQILKDGDAVMIGKTLFRFAVRPAIERRS